MQFVFIFLIVIRNLLNEMQSILLNTTLLKEAVSEHIRCGSYTKETINNVMFLISEKNDLKVLAVEPHWLDCHLMQENNGTSLNNLFVYEKKLDSDQFQLKQIKRVSDLESWPVFHTMIQGRVEEKNEKSIASFKLIFKDETEINDTILNSAQGVLNNKMGIEKEKLYEVEIDAAVSTSMHHIYESNGKLKNSHIQDLYRNYEWKIGQT